VNKLYLKLTAFTKHLPLKVLDFSKVLSWRAAYIGKIAFLQIIAANTGKFT